MHQNIDRHFGRGHRAGSLWTLDLCGSQQQSYFHQSFPVGSSMWLSSHPVCPQGLKRLESDPKLKGFLRQGRGWVWPLGATVYVIKWVQGTLREWDLEAQITFCVDLLSLCHEKVSPGRQGFGRGRVFVVNDQNPHMLNDWISVHLSGSQVEGVS